MSIASPLLSHTHLLGRHSEACTLPCHREPEGLSKTEVAAWRRDHEFLHDILRYDTKLRRWDGGFARVPFTARAYHTAVLLGHKIWVIGGSNRQEAFGDVWVFDTDSLSWAEVTLRQGGRLMLPLSPESPATSPFSSPAARPALSAGGMCSNPERGCHRAEYEGHFLRPKHRWHSMLRHMLAHACRRGQELLARTAHACVADPTQRAGMLLFCGYGKDLLYRNDVVLLDTARCA